MDLKKAKECYDCGGQGGGHSDYVNSDHHIERGAGDWEDCLNCDGTGFEQDADIVKERIVENLNVDQENKLQEYFIGLKEVGGIPIIKDNCEDMFDNWLGSIPLVTLEKIFKDVE